jgi:undecaprenyl diphosphate synthase
MEEKLSQYRNTYAFNHIPRHVAIIMDGNGRWAKQRNKLRTSGHKAGIECLNPIVSHCAKQGVKVLTLFAFGRDNWTRPLSEVNLLMNLFASTLDKEIERLHQNNVQVSIIGDRSRLSSFLTTRIESIELKTQANTGLKLCLAIDYSGSWDITQASKRAAEKVASGDMRSDDITPTKMSELMQTASFGDVDLLIRTSGEKRLSNFMLWQLAYAELYFTEKLWPDFTPYDIDLAIAFYNSRERRFGKVSEQIKKERK